MGVRTGGGLKNYQFELVRKALYQYCRDGKIDKEERTELVTILSGHMSKEAKKRLVLKKIKDNYVYGNHAIISNNFFLDIGIKSRTLQVYIKELREENKITVQYDRMGKNGGLVRYISLVDDDKVVESA